jgi:iron complex outermembrane receptor protein
MMNNRVCLFVACILLSLPCFANSEEAKPPKESIVPMDEVVVTATRSEEKVERIPTNITVIDQEAIRNSNARNIPELMRTEEGIVVRDWTGNGKQVEVDLRGFGESAPSNTLVLVDGRRVNQIDLSGVDWTQIPLDQIERIEIVRGTGTVLYGDNAVGGVINIITKTPSDRFAFSAGVTSGSYSRNKEQVSVSGGQGPLAVAFYGSHDATQGHRENNDYRAKDVGGKIVYDVAQFVTLNLSGAYHMDAYGLPGYLTLPQLNTDRRGTSFPLDNGSTADGYLKSGIDLALGEFGNLMTDVSYRNRETDTDWMSSGFVQNSVIDTWSLTPRYVWSRAIAGHRNTLIAGMDLYWTDQDTESYAGVPALLTGLSTVEKDSVGLYLNNDFSILETLILSLGARYESMDYRINQRDPLTGFNLLDTRFEESEYAYTAGLSFLYIEKSSVFVRANRSFRFPLTDELIEFDQSTFTQVINADLKPQTGQHYEAGVKHYFTPGIQGNITFFRAQMKNEIFLDPTPKPLWGTNENHPETLHQGFELGASIKLSSTLAFFGNYTYEKATFEAPPFEGNDIPAIPRNKFNLGFRLHDLVPGFAFSAIYTYVGSSYLVSDQANQVDKLKSYSTVDARLSYAWKCVNAFFGVNNLFDEKYSSYGVASTSLGPVFYPSPERNWVAGIELRF